MRPYLAALTLMALLTTSAAYAQTSLILPVDGRIGEGFGPRADPQNGQMKVHQGLDFLAPIGTPVKAAAAGTVSFVGDLPGFGTLIKIDHDGGLATRYAHLSRTDVKTGDIVTAGQVIGAVGRGNRDTAPQLHFEVLKDGEPQDPAGYLPLKP